MIEQEVVRLAALLRSAYAMGWQDRDSWGTEKPRVSCETAADGFAAAMLLKAYDVVNDHEEGV